MDKNSGRVNFGLLVLGMHRSGTSAVTGMIDRLGIRAAGDLLPPADDNKKGFFESRTVTLFHDRLLTHLGSAWDDPMPISTHFVETPSGQGFVRELADIIRRELLTDAPAFAIKDPRMCRFIPLWKVALRELETEPRAIIPLRHPLEVASSLASRDRFPRAKSFLLWLEHTLAAERETRDLTRSLIAYDGLLSDWRGVSEKLAVDLKLTWPTERARVEDAIDHFLSPELRHHATSSAIGNATRLDSLVAASWSALCALMENTTDKEAYKTLDKVHQQLSEATSVVSPYVAWEFSALAQSRNEVGRLVQEQRSLQSKVEHHERDRANIRQAVERASWLEQRMQQLESEANHLRYELHQTQATLCAVNASTSWRVTAPLRAAMGTLSSSTRLSLRRVAKAGWWVVTPWRMPARIRFLQERKKGILSAPAESSTVVSPVDSLASIEVIRHARKGSSSQPPLGIFEVEGGHPRLSMVTDSINTGSLFGGVATALIFSALLAKQTGRRLRIVTRTQAPAAENVATVFRAHGIDWADNIEFAFADINEDKSRIDVHPDELFVTTSWWTTQSTRESIADEQILYLLQEDERMFYPVGDDYLACSETIGDHRIRRVINSQLLHEHLKEEGIIDTETPFFEPSFPENIYYPQPTLETEKRNFFFYARPNNVRNLYSRGIDVIERAIERGILDPKEWNIHFVGKDLVPLQLASGVQPIILQNLSWEAYAAYVRSVDLALTLMYTPHPSYPPLDVAACGGVAVTNSFGVKTDLSRYSHSIVCTDSDIESLVEGLRVGIARALDQNGRRKSLAESRIKRSWHESFEPVFQSLLKGGRFVH